jgi:hypothetical protein
MPAADMIVIIGRITTLDPARPSASAAAMSGGRFVELFVVLSWDEHLRQHRARLTGVGQQDEEEVEGLSERPSHTTHMLAVDVARSP